MTADDLVQAVVKLGPMVCEIIECQHCGQVEAAAHPFCESVCCDRCGKRNPSNVPVYNDRPFGDT